MRHVPFEVDTMDGIWINDVHVFLDTGSNGIGLFTVVTILLNVYEAVGA